MDAGKLDRRGQGRWGLPVSVTMGGTMGPGHDISAQGLLFESSIAPELGAVLPLDVHFRADGSDCRLHCEGQVVRVERHGESFNVAVKLSQPLFNGG